MSKKPLTKRESKNPVKNPEIMEKRTGSWTQALVTLVFILIPAIVMWIFLSKDFNAKQVLTTGELWAVAIGFVSYALLITLFLMWIQLIWIDTMNFTLPVAMVLMSILLSQDVVIWGRALIVISLIFTALPVNMFTIRYIERRVDKNRKAKK
ncbi:MAG3450 family membrane protein [Mycoplasma todarodis]|uniref:MAG3450 family membrane protein n=1 Tax=Mycoplasma todarodis TaxID=1937191 RepID=UPI003B307B09